MNQQNVIIAKIIFVKFALKNYKKIIIITNALINVSNF